MTRLTALRIARAGLLLASGLCLTAAPASAADKPEPPKPTAHEDRVMEGWPVHVDKRLLEGPDTELGAGALKLLSARLADIARLMAPDRLVKLREAPIWLDLTHGKLKSMQYHPSAGWLRDNGYATELAKCVHIPDAAGFVSPHHQHRQPWSTLQSWRTRTTTVSWASRSQGSRRPGSKPWRASGTTRSSSSTAARPGTMP